MKTKVLALIALVAVFATALTLGGGTARAAGPTCTVPGTYATIQAAVNDPGCTTINVAVGLYVENVTINRTLTLNGAQASNPVAGRTSGGPAESTVQGANPIGANPVITVNGAAVTIDGFTLKNSITMGAAVGIDVKVGGNATAITNNIIDTITTVDTGGNGTAQGIYLETGPDNVKILANDIRNIQSARSAKGVLIGFNGGPDPSQNTLIQGNSIQKITSTSRGAYAVSVANVVGVSGLRILDNTIDSLNGGRWVHAIGLEGDTPGVVVKGNTISNLVGPAPTSTIAVWFESEDVSFPSGNVNENNFDVGTAAFGIAVDPSLSGTTSVDGTCNWWGAANGPGPVGPGSGAQVSPRVTFTPWLTAPAPSGPCNGPLPHPTTTTVSCTPSTVPVGMPTTCTATVTDTNAPPTAPTGMVTFTASGGTGSFDSTTCTLGTPTSNSASCSVHYTPTSTGTQTITANYGGDTTHAKSSGSTTITVVPFATASGASFVLGDLSSSVGSQVTWWGAQWSKENSLSGGSAPASFKGFAANVSRSGCSGTWTTGPGNSSDPPATVPSTMAVIVSSNITKAGSTISGNITHIVIVQTDPGYAANPGHPGTGKVVSMVC